MSESAAKCKNAADILGLIDVVSLIERWSDFLQPFLSELIKIVLPFSHKVASKAAQGIEGVEFVLIKWTQQRLVIRVLAELNSYGLVSPLHIGPSYLRCFFNCFRIFRN